MIASFGNFAFGCLEKAKQATQRILPAGLIQRVIIQLVFECTGAYAIDSLIGTTLDKTEIVARSIIPLYRSVPLMTLVAGQVLVIKKVSQNSRVLATVLATSIPILFGMYSRDELEQKTAQVAGFIIYNLGSMTATVVGGYCAIFITGTNVDFLDYRKRTINSALAQQVFEGCVKGANNIPLKLVRKIAAVGVGTAAFNGKAVWRAIRITARRKKNYGVIGPVLTELVCEKLQTLTTKSMASQLSKQVLPFFSARNSSFIAANFTAPLLARFVSSLKGDRLVNSLNRSTIEYFALIGENKLNLLMARLYDLFMQKDEKLEIDLLTKGLQESLQDMIVKDSIFASKGMECFGKNAIWSEAHLAELTQVISTNLQKMGLALTGRAVYPTSHLQFIEKMIAIHLKPYAAFIISRAVDSSTNKEPLDDIEEIQLIAIMHHLLFFTAIQPVIPKQVTAAVEKGSHFITKMITNLIYHLQGFKAKTYIRLPEITENYVREEPEGEGVVITGAAIVLVEDYVPSEVGGEIVPGSMQVIEDYVKRN